jgi:hypothetical protein
VIDGSGGSIAFGALTFTLPAGALLAPTDVTIEELSGSAPPAVVGSVYDVLPGGLQLALPATVTFAVDGGVLPSDVTIAHQDAATGYWFRRYDVARDASTISAQASEAGSYALVSLAAQRDLAGAFQLTSAQERSFTAAGSATLQHLADDPPFSIYAVTGTIEMQQPMPDGCALAGAALQPMPLSIAELQPGVKFRWAIDGRWDLTCAGGAAFVGTNFDTLGVTNIGCQRGWVGTPVLDTAHVQGEYAIDCGAAGGQVTASWDLLPP